MPTEVHLAVAFGLGLASSLHCLGMCGAIMAALAMGVAPDLRGHPATLLKFTIGYSLGRVFSYALAGALLAGLGQQMVAGGATAHKVVQSVAWLLVVAMAMQLAGLPTPLSGLERAAGRVWQRIAPAARALLPVRHTHQALALGAIWGWMPCGLVYATLIWAAGTGDALQGAAAMAAFGAGTLPAVVSGGLLGARLASLARRRAPRLIASALLLAVASIGLWQAWSPHQHAGHTGHDRHGTAGDPAAGSHAVPEPAAEPHAHPHH